MDYLLKSSICLFVFWGFYKLTLENTSWHRFKRLFLLMSLIFSAIIPLIIVRTITIPIAALTATNLSALTITDETAIIESSIIGWELMLWTVYGLGVFIMSFRFIRNLYNLLLRSDDEVQNYKTYDLVLRKLVVVPHSFFNKIYASITEYKSGAIPEAVLEHEKAHLDQKHSWDILFIELMTIVLWFNPLVYLLKFSIKLNHEFLADESVLNTGQDAKDYQRMLLAFAASSQNRNIANTFNFPIIKKRFTIMNTKTSPTSGLLRSLALIPVIALLVISCGKEDVEIEEVEEIIEIREVQGNWVDPKVLIIDKSSSSGTVVLFDGTKYSYTSKNNVTQFFDSSDKLWDFKKAGYKIVDEELIIEEIEVVEILAEVTPEDIKEYNRLAKIHSKTFRKDNTFIINDETVRMQLIYNSMNKEQKVNSEPWPYTFEADGLKAGELPPPPPPANPEGKQGFIKVDGNIFRYSSKGADNEYYDHDGTLINLEGQKVEELDANDVPPPPPPAKKKNENTTGFNSTQKAQEVSTWVEDFENVYKENDSPKMGAKKDWKTTEYFTIGEYTITLINAES
jgi:beta-lactamase regulating signal transducer with metallopeptidase domain